MDIKIPHQDLQRELDVDDQRFCRGRPLGFHWNVNPEIVLTLDLPAPHSDNDLAARNSIIAEALIGAETGQCVSFSRRKNAYAHQRRYRGTAYTYTTVIRATDQLDELGWIKVKKAAVGSLGWQSTFRATPTLIERVGGIDLGFSYNPHELIRLRNMERKLVPYAESEFTRQARRDQAAFNEAYEAADIVLDAPDIEWSGRVVHVDDAIVLPARKACYRVFNRSPRFDLGGRSYGGFWQSLPKTRRKQLTINGDPVESHDHSQLHPRLLYAERSLLIDGDAYDVPGHDRSIVKVAFNVAINAETRRSGVLAIADRMGGPSHRKAADKLLTAIEARHSRIGDAFCSGAGLRLQSVDADMAAYVSQRAIREGIVALPIHDEFVARRGRDADRVKEFMEESFHMARAV